MNDAAEENPLVNDLDVDPETGRIYACFAYARTGATTAVVQHVGTTSNAHPTAFQLPVTTGRSALLIEYGGGLAYPSRWTLLESEPDAYFDPSWRQSGRRSETRVRGRRFLPICQHLILSNEVYEVGR